ncbi:MAG: GTPase [Sulfolobaceae archaeon]
MLNPFERLQIPENVEEFIKIQLESLRKIKGNTKKDREIRRLARYFNNLSKYEIFLKSFPNLDNLHPFYKESIEIIAKSSIDDVKRCLIKSYKSIKIAKILLKKYINKIKKEENDPNLLMRQGFGRASSVLRENKDCINFLISIAKEAKKLKSVDPTLPTIIIAGAPNVGKSTLVSKISTAKPEIAHYPFTTKDIHVGHIFIDDSRVQVIDTPGILDRPMSERNLIERKAINAIVNLNGIIVFLIDVSKDSLYTPEQQINLLKEVINTGKEVIIVLNKIDKKDETIYNQVISELLRMNRKWIEISSEKGYNLDILLQETFKLLGIKATGK